MRNPGPMRQIDRFRLIFSRFLRNYKELLLLLLLAFLNGLVYMFIFPPWQHFDEPGHFEYGWLIANRPGFPQIGDYDREMRVAVAKSMIDHGFFDEFNFTPDLDSINEPAWIGNFQVGDPVMYYLIVSMPLRLIRGLQIDTQLYVSRLVSLLFYLITVLAAWGITREITSPGSPLRLLLPATIALLPSVAGIMTSVNNDVGAIAFFSLFLWGGVRLIKGGFTWATFLFTLAVTILGIFTKNTIYFSLFLIPLILILSLPAGMKWVKIIVLVLGIVFLFIVSVSWGDARYWYRSTLQSQSTRIKDSQAVLGKYVISLDSAAEVSQKFLTPVVQPLPQKSVEDLSGKSVTFGAWMWANKPVQVRMPMLRTVGDDTFRKVNLSTVPTFFAMNTNLAKELTRLWIGLTPQPRDGTEGVTVYYDGLILVEGNRPLKEEPYFEDANGQYGIWGGKPFVNLLRNPSAEQGSLMFKSWVDVLAKRVYPVYGLPSFYFSYLSDWQGAIWHYQATATQLFRTFWGQFGWGNVPLLGNKPYRACLLISIIGILGTGIGLWLRRKSIPWEVLILFGLVLIFGWGIAFLRGAPYMVAGNLFLPVARYASSAIIPTVFILAFGWIEIIRLTGHKFGFTQQVQIVTYFSLLLVLNLYSLISIYNYFYITT